MRGPWYLRNRVLCVMLCVSSRVVLKIPTTTDRSFHGHTHALALIGDAETMFILSLRGLVLVLASPPLPALVTFPASTSSTSDLC
jgi:hypothetical protein